jgi:hypothetical protein
MDQTANLAPDPFRRLWAALAQTPGPLYLLVGKRPEAQAHLRGSFLLETADGEDVVVLAGTRTHVHVHWSSITRVERSSREGYDTLRVLSGDTPLLELLTAEPGTTFSPQVVAQLEACDCRQAVSPRCRAG